MMAAALRRLVARRAFSTQAAGSKWPEGVAVVTLDRPESRNALSLDFLQTLRQRFADASAQDGAKVRRRAVCGAVRTTQLALGGGQVIVLEAQGPVFSAGHDLKELASADRDTLSEVFSTAGALCGDIRSLPQPVIARVHALATAAGCQLAGAVPAPARRASNAGLTVGRGGSGMRRRGRSRVGQVRHPGTARQAAAARTRHCRVAHIAGVLASRVCT